MTGGNREYVLEIMRWFGGYEMVMAVGGMLRASELHMTVLVDGFIMTNCILAARELYPAVVESISREWKDRCKRKRCAVGKSAA